MVHFPTPVYAEDIALEFPLEAFSTLRTDQGNQFKYPFSSLHESYNAKVLLSAFHMQYDAEKTMRLLMDFANRYRDKEKVVKLLSEMSLYYAIPIYRDIRGIWFFTFKDNPVY